VKRISFLLLLAAVGCTSSSTKPAAPPPAPTASPAAKPTPGIRSRIDSTVIEETDTYVIRALPKKDYVKVDDYNVREPVLPNQRLRFFKQDENYYYVSEPKAIPEEEAAKRQLAEQQAAAGTTPSARAENNPSPGVTAADFEDLDPPRTGARIHLSPVARTGLPEGGMWRASFVVADMNGDGIPDIVAPPNRLGNGKLRIWIGDGKGGFSDWPITFSEDGKTAARFTVDYGGVAVGDIDGDGKADVAVASHSSGVVVLYGDGKGGFRVERAGLPHGDFSSQAVILLDANGDGKLDIVASRDIPGSETVGVDKQQVRVYLNLGKRGFEWEKEGLIGGFYSTSLAAFDFDGSGRKSALTGSNYTGALTLLWKSRGDGTFAPEQFDAIEPYAYHPVTTPGTFGSARIPAFADAYYSMASVPEVTRASGVTVYAYRDGKWERHRVWRQKNALAAVSALAVGDVDGDGLDDVVFADNVRRQLRVFFQQPDGSFVELDEKEEPKFQSPGQWLRLADLDGDGRLDFVLSRTVTSAAPHEVGGWDVWLNRAK
jgi:FG-GAP-like repeat